MKTQFTAIVLVLLIIGLACSKPAEKSTADSLQVLSVKSKVVETYANTNYEICTLVRILNPQKKDFAVTVKLLDAEGFALDSYTFSSNGTAREKFEQRGDTTIYTGTAMLSPSAYSKFVSTSATVGASKY